MSKPRFDQRSQDVEKQQNAGKDIYNYNINQESFEAQLIYDLWKEQTKFTQEMLKQSNKHFISIIVVAGIGSCFFSYVHL